RGRGIHMVLAEAGIKQNCVPAEAAPHRGVALAIPLSPRGRAWERATETQCAETKKASVCHAHRSNKCDLSHIMVKPFGLVYAAQHVLSRLAIRERPADPFFWQLISNRRLRSSLEGPVKGFIVLIAAAASFAATTTSPVLAGEVMTDRCSKEVAI